MSDEGANESIIFSMANIDIFILHVGHFRLNIRGLMPIQTIVITAQTHYGMESTALIAATCLSLYQIARVVRINKQMVSLAHDVHCLYPIFCHESLLDCNGDSRPADRFKTPITDVQTL